MDAGLDEWTEVLAALSLATDLANGHDYEKTLRSCVLAEGLAEAMGLSEAQRRDVFHATLVRFIGCTSFAHEEAVLFGDDIAARHAFATVDYDDKGQLWRASGEAMAELGPLDRFARRSVGLLRAPAGLRTLYASQCEVGERFGTRMSMSPGVVRALGQIHERWDGRGGPRGLRGDALEVVVQVQQVANLAELVHQRLGAAAVCEVVAARSGSALAPEPAQVLVARAADLLAPLEQGSTWDAFVSIGARHPTIEADRDVDEVVEAFADFADLTTVYTLGHSSAVAETAERAAASMGVEQAERDSLRRAARLHDLGRVAVPAALWEKRGALSPADWERIRLHAYYGQRILSRAPSLRAAAVLANADHERCDRSGYPGAVDAASLPIAARILAAADVYCALREDRPHRPRMTDPQARDELRREVEAGRLHREAVDAVLGTPSRRRDPTLPAGLTPREVEVLRWVARGDTNKEVAQRLRISPRTVGHHLAHAYEKLGVSTRAAAALFVVEHGLVQADEPR